MKMIHKFAEQIKEELEGAKHYAEKYIEYRAKGDSTRAMKYKEMANDELRHAQYVHDFALQDVEAVKKVYTLSVEAESEWEHAHKHFAECTAMVRMMLG